MDLTETFKKIKKSSRDINFIDDSKKAKVLLDIADSIENNSEFILTENKKDLDKMDINNPKYDGLKLTIERLVGIASDMRNVAKMPSPLGKILDDYTRPNGMRLKKVTVAFGVIGIIYESRPNVTFDVFSLCFKAGSACVLKGSKDAQFSNAAIVSLMHKTLEKHNISTDVCTLLPADREATSELLKAQGYVDILIPRGSAGLINYVRDNAKIPVIETGAGVCHTFFDKDGDMEKGINIINNAKTRRVSVCNALDCLVIHKNRLNDLPALCKKLSQSKVIIYADAPSYKALKGNYPDEMLEKASPDCFGHEWLDYKITIKTANNSKEAIDYISDNTSGHSECIISNNKQLCDVFDQCIDAACVYRNVSTAFTDGSQFGLGAEIGISTQKLHARGPMALKEITTYKWLISGDGQIRA